MYTYDTLLAKVSATGGTAREVTDPATGERVGAAPVSAPADVESAVARAVDARQAWATRSDGERRQTLLELADAVDQSAEALALLLTREQGKPLNGPNARFEVGACAAGCVPPPPDLPSEMVWTTRRACRARLQADGRVGVIGRGTGR